MRARCQRLSILLLTVCATLPIAHAGECTQAEWGPGLERVGVYRSIDGGATWTRLTPVCLHDPALVPADPSPIAVAGGVALYVLDLQSLNSLPSIIYRAFSADGFSFSSPVAAFSTNEQITDPYVLAMPGGFRMYLQSTRGILSAWSSDGITFVADPGIRTTAGGVPGALRLPDGRVRLFVGGISSDGVHGIISLISDNGLDFTLESGARIASSASIKAANPHPIGLPNGTYLMAYAGVTATPLADELHLATSTDGFSWTAGPAVGIANMPGLVLTADGTLLTYYVDFKRKRERTVRR